MKKSLLTLSLIFSPILLFMFVKIFFPEFLTLTNVMTDLEIIYSKYGPFIIFFGGLLESIFLLNFFVPGSVAILLGAVLAAKGVISLPAVIILGTAGLLIGYSFDYLMGRKGWFEVLKKYKFFDMIEDTGEKLAKKGSLLIFINGFSPNSASIVAVSAGIIKYKYLTFIITVLFVQLFWSTFWGIIFYLFGTILVTNLVYWAIFAVVSVSIAVVSLKKTYNRSRP